MKITFSTDNICVDKQNYIHQMGGQLTLILSQNILQCMLYFTIYTFLEKYNIITKFEPPFYFIELIG
jgi:hypothetical protein